MKYINIKTNSEKNIFWGLGIGDWGLGPIPHPAGPNAKPPTPLTQPPNPTPLFSSPI